MTAIPLVWDLVVTMTASYQKVFSDNPAIGYFAQAQRYRDAEAAGELLAPAQDQGQMDQIIFNSTLNGILQSFFAVLVLIVVVHAAVVVLKAIRAGGCPPRRNRPSVPAGRAGGPHPDGGEAAIAEHERLVGAGAGRSEAEEQ